MSKAKEIAEKVKASGLEAYVFAGVDEAGKAVCCVCGASDNIAALFAMLIRKEPQLVFEMGKGAYTAMKKISEGRMSECSKGCQIMSNN